jgi:signal transduction histidine kinase
LMNVPPGPDDPIGGGLVWAALHAMGEGITLTAKSGRIVYSNPAADRILGRAASSGDPDGWAEHYGVFVPDSFEPFPTGRYPLVRALAGEETDGVEMFIRNPARPEGALISVTGRPVRDADGTIVGAAVVFRDITALRTAERARRELMGFLVHDMKGPLTTILGNVDLLRLDEASEQGFEMLEDVSKAAHNLHRMTLDLLDIHTAEDGRLEADLEPVDVALLLRSAEASARAHGCRVAIEARGPRQIWADPDLIRRVVGNLVDNCIKYGPAGGVISLCTEPLGEGGILIQVKDEGPGVPEQLRDAIFESYAKLERDVGRRRAGSRGLGLRFCKVAVEAHGGRIWVEDREPCGAVFCVELPAELPSAERTDALRRAPTS